MTDHPFSLQVIGSKKFGGAERFFIRLCDALHERGAPVIAVTPKRSELSLALALDTPRETSIMRSVLDPFSHWDLRRLIKRLQPDIVQTWMGRATRLVRLPRGAAPVHLARLGGYYKVSHYLHAHALIGNTKGICDYLVREGLPAERIYHIGNFVDPPRELMTDELTRLRRDHDIPEDAICILGIGRLHANKDFSTLLQAYALLKPHRYDRPLRLILVGDGPDRENIEALAYDLGIRNSFIMPGWQTDITPWYALGHVFVCPSKHEPLGNVILEAWAHGIPVISTCTQGATELISHERDGLIVPTENPRALAQAIESLLADPERAARELALQGSITLERQHSAKHVVNSYLDLYEQLRIR